MSRAQFTAERIHDLVHVIDDAQPQLTLTFPRGETAMTAVGPEPLWRNPTHALQSVRREARVFSRKLDWHADLAEIGAIFVGLALTKLSRVREGFA
jgi:uncharacterized protein YcbX